MLPVMALVLSIYLWLNRSLDRRVPPPPTMRERLDSLALAMTGASKELRDVAKRVEDETAKITSELDKQLEQAEAEVHARQAKLDELLAKSRQYEQTAAMHEEQAAAVSDYFALRVKEITHGMERQARRREWGLGTVGAVLIGLVTAVVARYLGL